MMLESPMVRRFAVIVATAGAALGATLLSGTAAQAYTKAGYGMARPALQYRPVVMRPRMPPSIRHYHAMVLRRPILVHRPRLVIGNPCHLGHRFSIPRPFEEPRTHVGPRPNNPTPIPAGYYPSGPIPHPHHRPCLVR
jgi:hypothetical protein